MPKAAVAAEPEIEVLLIDFDSIKLVGDDSNPEIVTISQKDGFFLNERVSKDFRIRKSIYDMMKKAQKNLPENYHLVVYEAYRPLARQKYLWDKVMGEIREKYPKAGEKEILDMTETCVANPYNGIGSGHQAGCAIDVSLCDKNGREYDMGTECQQFNQYTKTFADGLPAEALRNRKILVKAMEDAGFAMYPAEWWHYSYGDHQWAFLKGETEAFYGPLDI